MVGTEQAHTDNNWRFGISNLSLPRPLLLLGGIRATRNYLRSAGLQDGLKWIPTTRTRLYAEIRAQAARGDFQNNKSGWWLIHALEQSYSQPWSNIRTAQQIGERALMPPVRDSLIPLRSMQGWLGEERLYATLYTEALRKNESYNDRNAPFIRGQVISPDLAYKRDYSTMGGLVQGLYQHGIDFLSFSNIHSVRSAQDKPNLYLEPYSHWLPGLLRDRKVGEISLSFARGDLKPRQSTAIGTSYDQLREILSGNPNEERLGDLPEQLRIIRTETPPDAKPFITLGATATNIQQANPLLQPVAGHRLLVQFVAERLS